MVFCNHKQDNKTVTELFSSCNLSSSFLLTEVPGQSSQLPGRSRFFRLSEPAENPGIINNMVTIQILFCHILRIYCHQQAGPAVVFRILSFSSFSPYFFLICRTRPCGPVSCTGILRIRNVKAGAVVKYIMHSAENGNRASKRPVLQSAAAPGRVSENSVSAC